MGISVFSWLYLIRKWHLSNCFFSLCILVFSFYNFWMVDLTVPLHILNCFKFEQSPLIKDSNLLYRDRIYSKNKEHKEFSRLLKSNLLLWPRHWNYCSLSPSLPNFFRWKINFFQQHLKHRWKCFKWKWS